jgi:hypothetical protein
MFARNGYIIHWMPYPRLQHVYPEIVRYGGATPDKPVDKPPSDHARATARLAAAAYRDDGRKSA